MKKFILAILFAITAIGTTRAQSMVTEIAWNVYNQHYSGLLVLYPNNNGTFVVKFFSPNVGWVWVSQDAVLTNTYDIYGNCTSYINCYNPKTSPYVPYAADNFLVYPNGQMYTQDAAGNWSTLIAGQVIPPAYWNAKFSEYGIQ